MKRREGKADKGKKHGEGRAALEYGDTSGPRQTDKRPVGEGRPADELSALREKAEKAGEYYESLLRLKAEFENFKKRTLKEKAEYMRHANQELMLELLPVIDSLELGLESAGKTRDFDKLIQGLKLALNGLFQVLGKFGLKEMEAAGRKFDPNFHEAVTLVESDKHGDDTVVDEIRKGYLLHNKLLRPATVTVAGPRRRPSSGEERGSEESSDRSNERQQG